MQVILLMIVHVVVNQDQMNDGMMWWTVPSRKKRLLKLWKGWQKIEDKEKHRQGKWNAKSAVQAARKKAQEAKFGDLKCNDQHNQIFKEARRMKNENQDIVEDKCIEDDDGNLVFGDKSKLAAWKSNYEKLLNAPCLKNNRSKVLLLGLPLRWLAKHSQR